MSFSHKPRLNADLTKKALPELSTVITAVIREKINHMNEVLELLVIAKGL